MDGCMDGSSTGCLDCAGLVVPSTLSIICQLAHRKMPKSRTEMQTWLDRDGDGNEGRSLHLPLSLLLALCACVCEGPGPKGFPCYACDVCLTLSLACPGSTGCKKHPNDWPLSRHTTRSFVLYPLSPCSPPSLSLCTLSGCTRMVSFTFYVRMLLFFELWRQEHRERDRERGRETNPAETRTWAAVWPCAALCRTALRCFLPGAADHSRKCCVSTRFGLAVHGLGVRSRILFKTLPRNRIFDAGMSGYHKNASDNGQRPPHCPQCRQPAMAPKSKHCTDSVAVATPSITSSSPAYPTQLPSADSSQLQPPPTPPLTVFWALPPFQLLQPEPKPGCNCYELGQLATWLGYWLFG